MRASADSTRARIASSIASYSPAIARQLSACRRKLRARFPRGFELVYDNYNALVFAFSPSEKTSQAFVSIAGYPRWVTLFFVDAGRLRDPAKLLEGSGRKIRAVRLASPADLDRKELRALLAQAIELRATALAQAPKLKTVLKSVAATRRPRRAAAQS